MATINILSGNDLLNAARDGITKEMVNAIIRSTGLSLNEFGRYIHLTARAIQRKKLNEKLSPGASERALLISNLYNKGCEVFGSKDKFKEWIESKNIVFSNAKPKEYLDTFSGIEYLMEELGRIEHGFMA
jgi:putative toxin-antitoxin system antitoxin component (TIGR02293 family)